MKILKKEEKGWALVVSLLVGSLMLSVTAIMLSKTLDATKDVIKTDKDNKKKELTDTVVASTINWMNQRSWGDDTSTSIVKEVPLNLNLNGLAFVGAFYDTGAFDLLNTNSKAQITSSTTNFVDPDLTFTGSLRPYGNLDPQKNFYLNDFLNNKTNRSTNFLTGSIKKMNSVIVYLAGANSSFSSQTGGAWGINELPEKMYRSINIEYGESSSKIKAEARITVLPLSTNVTGFSDKEMHDNAGTGVLDFNLIPAHEDIYKIYTKVCFPDCTTGKDIRLVDLILKRPIVIGSGIPPYAVYADGAIDIQNASTSSGTTNNVINSTNEGDVHSNTSVTVGAVGHVGGKLTSSGTAMVGADTIPNDGIPAVGDPLCSSLGGLCTTTQVVNKPDSKSNVEPVPKPDWDFTPYPTTECNTTVGWSDSPQVLKDCRVTGNYSVSGTVKFEGDVYVTGKLDSKGNDSIVAQGSTGVRIIVDGQIDLGGNGGVPSTQDVIFVSNYSGPAGCAETMSCPDAIKIAGTPSTGTNTGSLFYTTNPNSNVKIAGTADFFGGVISSGTVTGNGQPDIRRDTDMSGLNGRIPQKKDSLMMKIVSWKESRN
jgi:hypothetical protein